MSLTQRNRYLKPATIRCCWSHQTKTGCSTSQNMKSFNWSRLILFFFVTYESNILSFKKKSVIASSAAACKQSVLSSQVPQNVLNKSHKRQNISKMTHQLLHFWCLMILSMCKVMLQSKKHHVYLAFYTFLKNFFTILIIHLSF